MLRCISYFKVIPSVIPPGCDLDFDLTGGVVAPLLNHRLLSANPSGSEFSLISSDCECLCIDIGAASKPMLRASIQHIHLLANRDHLAHEHRQCP
ncbi:MAG: hypothetical protein JWN70_2347 [Planctomycetaceae bacterium]|nr:hypothetical protein [Planctomycetaceae bacterium]